MTYHCTAVRTGRTGMPKYLMEELVLMSSESGFWRLVAMMARIMKAAVACVKKNFFIVFVILLCAVFNFRQKYVMRAR